MVGNEWDDILYWEDYELFKRFISDLDCKYNCNDPMQYEAWRTERDTFYRRTIPTKEEFVRRFERYALVGKPHWIDGHHKQINELTADDLMKSYHYASDENGKERVAVAEKARKSWASAHLPYYVGKVCAAIAKPYRILEMTVGAGVGTNAIVRSMTEDMTYIGVDIDFICAKNADAIGRYYQKNALGLCASLWHLPFENETFDVACSHFGLDECREIPTILDEASRVLKTGGKLVLVSRHSGWSRRHDIFEKYGINEEQATALMRSIRLYADFEQLNAFATERGLVKTDYVPFETWYVAEYRKEAKV